MRRAPGFILGGVLAVALGTGCHRVNYTAPERYERGLVVVLSGAGDIMGEVDSIRSGLDSGGVKQALETFRWSQGEVLTDQTALEHNRRMAQRLARRLEAYERQYPGRPVRLIGVSAGTGIAVFAIENLRAPAHVTDAILLSSSLQAHYNLASALQHVRQKLYVFTNSAADVVLSAGVGITGTVDRSGNAAGGLFGFTPPENAAAVAKQLYKDKLVHIAWRPGDILLGNPGDHLGPTRSAFVRDRIAPIVLGRPPEEASASCTPSAAPQAKEAAPTTTTPCGEASR